MRRTLAAALWLVTLACTSDPEPGLDGALLVLVRYDSSLPVAELRVAAVGQDGAALWPPEARPAPLFLDPPGPREAALAFPRPAAGALTVLVDGLDAAGAVVGSGQGGLQLEATGEARVPVTLGPAVTCGDGRRAGREACDDGDLEGADGCSPLCIVEPGWACSGAPSRCTRCGDGVRQPPEACDDGNDTPGDGCSPTCVEEGTPRPHLVEVEVLEPVEAEGPDWTLVEPARLRLASPGAGERWVVFASGVLGSSSAEEQSSEAGLFVDEVLVRRFGHQTLGGADNGAGFVTFVPLEEGVGGEVGLGLAARAGVTTASQLRLVAMRVPAGAAVAAQAGEDVEAEGVDLGLLAMDLPADTPGRYLVMGQGSLTESPGADTARMWMSTPMGRRPQDERGVTFSSPRDAEVPFFAAELLALDAGEHRIELRGTSSGSGAVDDWWSARYAYRRRITVTAGAAPVPEGYAVPITFDHAAMVAAGRARADGGDVRVVYAGRLELTRVADPDRGWGRADTTVWVAVPTQIPADGTLAELWMYLGAPQVEPPPADPADVLPFFDGFDGAALGPQWVSTLPAVVQGGLLTLDPGQGLFSQLATQANLLSILVEARLRYEDPATSPTIALGVGGFADGAARSAAYLGTDQAQHVLSASGVVQAYEPDTPARFHRYGLGLVGQQAVFSQDGVEVGRLPLSLVADVASAFGMQNGGAAPLVYDWVRVRPFMEPEPTVSVEPLTGAAGLRPSRFGHLSLLALRLDAFAEVFAADAPQRVTTTESATVTLAKLEVPGADAPREHLVLMSTRVAGASGEWGRKEGLCLADGQALLRTAHRINRDASDATGYHHIAGVVDAVTTAATAVYSTAVRSPDGLSVEGAASQAVVLRF